jgi:DNA-binding MarR family transcriptional regulator
MTFRSSRVAGDSRADRALGRVFEFMQIIWAVDHGLNKISKHMEATLGVTGPQRLVIRLVGRFPGISPGRLAQLLRLHPSTLTGILKRLEAHRLVTRRPDERDRRRMLLELTRRGRRLDRPMRGTLEAAVRSVLVATSPRKVSAAHEVLAALVRELEAAPGR